MQRRSLGRQIDQATVLLNAWLRTPRKQHALPVISDFQPDGAADDPADMMMFDVAGTGDSARFLITQEGGRLSATYGNDHIDPARRTNRYLNDAIGPDRYARVVPSYRALLTRQRPTYSVLRVRDPDGKDVSYERLLLPFGSGGNVEQIVGSYKSVSIDGGFKINNLMGATPNVLPVIVISAVINLDFVPMSRSASEDLIELG